MTIGLAWVARRNDGRQHLYFASDSRTRGGMVLDACPKILTLPRSDCAICFAGNTAATYPLMMQIANAIAAHKPARERSLDIRTLKAHLLRLLTDTIGGVTDAADPIKKSDAQFLFGGYSWLTKSFALWTIYFSDQSQIFRARLCKNFHSRINMAAFIGDVAKEVRSEVFRRLQSSQDTTASPEEFIPLAVLRDYLRGADSSSSIGGPPQLVRIAEHMNTRVLAVDWPLRGPDGTESIVPTVFGRPLFDYENVDYWSINPDTFKVARPRSYGHRE